MKVVLTGEGSDELFAGYARYRFYLLNQRWLEAVPASCPARCAMPSRSRIASSRLLSGNVRRKLQHSVLGRGEDLESLYLDNFYCRIFPRRAGAPASCRRVDGTYDSFLRYWKPSRRPPLLPRMLYADQKTYLVELLMKQDQMSMACSIESRVPFLDHQFVEFAARVPRSPQDPRRRRQVHSQAGGGGSASADIVYRKKMGFPTPLRQWLMDPSADAADRAASGSRGLLAPYIDFTYLNDLLARHKSGLEDATDRIWRLLNLQLWGNIFITSKTGVLACLMTMNAGPSARMGPAEIGTRAQQAAVETVGRASRLSNHCLLPTPAFPDSPIACSLRQAEKICRHRFDLWVTRISISVSPIDWHFDPVHHKRAPRKPWHKIPFLDFDQVGDHKIIWELNRHQHLVTLGEAWRLPERTVPPKCARNGRTGNAKIPYPIGINWASTLEVAFRRSPGCGFATSSEIFTLT